MLRFAYSNLHYILGPTNDYEYKQRHRYDVVNPQHDVQQMIRQIEWSIGNAEHIKSYYHFNFIAPESLKINVFDKPSFIECCVFIDVMKAYIKYLDTEKERLMKNQEKLSNLFRTIITVENNTIDVGTVVDDLTSTIRLISKELLHGYEVQ